MWQCHYCRSPLSLAIQRQNRLCPTCGSDIHCCRNCIHFDETLSAKCREPHTPWVGDRNSQNACEYFEFRPTSESASHDTACNDINSEAERAKEAFRALFRMP